MLTLILVLLVILFIVFRVIAYIVDSDSYYCFSMVTCVFIIILIISICGLWTQVATEENMCDKKIAMYQEENTTIEQSIDQVVQEYMEHEEDTFAELKTDGSPITLVNLFPELKSDTLVQQQIEIYVANSDKIKNLKEEKINLGTAKWLLYFGT